MVGVGGRLLAMNPNTGGTIWDSALATSRGANEVERLVDLLSGYSKSANQVCVRSYLKNISCVDILQGKILWNKNAQGTVGLTGDNEMVVGVEDNGQLIAFNRANGDKLWFSDRLRNRVLSPPLLIGRSIVVGDDVGNLFFLSKNDATPLNKINLSGEKISFAPIVAGKTLLVVTGSGSVFGYYPQ
jgi:outer membrane protein assembly factor BamB